MNIRDNAIHCEAKKHAYRQTQDGVVVSFVLHPQEVPDGLALAPLGTRYMLALVEIGDDEQPVAGAGSRPAGRSIANGQRAAQRHQGGENEVNPHDTNPSNATSQDEPAPEKSQRSWHELKLSQQAGVLCNDIMFQKFLDQGIRTSNEHKGGGRGWSRPVRNVDDAAEAVRYLCAVNSRADLDKGAITGDRWREIVSLYRAWVREPEIVG